MTDPAPSDLRIAIVRFSALGDVVMVAAAVRALQQALPAATLTWITSPPAYSLMNGMAGITFAVAEKPARLTDYRHFYHRFRSQRFDVVLAMQANLRINLLYPSLRAPVKIGFDLTRAREGQWLFCNRRIPFRDDHLVDSFLAFVESLTGTPATAIWDFPLDEPDLAWARERLQALAPPWIAIHPRSSKVERNWLPERYAEVVAQAAARWNCGIVLTGGNSPAEAALCESLARHAPRQVLNLCGKTTARQFAALLSLVDVLVAPDTSAVHLATATGTPVVGLYAVASPKLSGPYQRLEYCVDRYSQAVKQLLGRDPDRLPWNTRVHDPRAMSLIEVADVMEQLDRVLGGHP